MWSFGLDTESWLELFKQSVPFYCSFHQIMLGIYEQISEGVLELQGDVSAQNHRAMC